MDLVLSAEKGLIEEIRLQLNNGADVNQKKVSLLCISTSF